jgi:PPIC-type PPIASE domain
MAQANTAIVDKEGKALPTYRAQRLDALIQQTIFEAAFEKAGLKVSQPYVDGLRKQIAADPSAKGFDSAFLDDFVESRGRIEALRVAKSKPITDEQVKAAYEQQYACASGKSVAHLLVKTEAEANAALQRIQNGESFAVVAQAVSTDTGSQQKGGELGCLAAGAFVPDFETAALAAVIGTPTAPVKTEFGYHVIETAVFVAPALAEVRAEIVAALQAQDTSGNDSLRKFLDSAKVTIEDRSIGTWGTTAQGVPGVIAKGTSPTPTSDGQPSVDTPTTGATTATDAPGIAEERPQKKSK